MRHFFAMPLLNAARNIVKMHAYFMRAYFNSLHFSDVVTCNADTILYDTEQLRNNAISGGGVAHESAIPHKI